MKVYSCEKRKHQCKNEAPQTGVKSLDLVHTFRLVDRETCIETVTQSYS